MKDYTTNELGIIVDDFKRSFDDFKKDNKEQHEKIIVQTTATNGKVMRLQLWRSGLVGAFSVIVFIIGLLGVSLYQQYIDFTSNMQSKVAAAVKAELTDKYNIQITK